MSEHLETTIKLPTAFIDELSHADSVENVLRVGTEWLTRLIPSVRGSIALVDGDQIIDKVARNDGIADPKYDAATIIPNAPRTIVLQTGSPVFLSDTEMLAAKTKPMTVLVNSGIRAMMLVPMLVGNQTVGTLSIGAHHPNSFGEDHARRLTSIGRWIGSQARLMQQLRNTARMAETDALREDFLSWMNNKTIQMNKLRFFLFPLIAFVIIALAFQCPSPLSTKGPESNYKTYCASCHGEQLQTFVDRKWLYGNSWNEVLNSIKNGYPDDGMSSYDTTFTDNEIRELADYILTGVEKNAIQEFEEEKLWGGEIQTEVQRFRLDTIASDLSSPWGMAQLPDGSLLVTDKPGTLYLYKRGTKTKITGTPKVNGNGQGGLMDVVLHPDFEINSVLYLSYSKPVGNNNTTALMRATLSGNRLTETKTIFEAGPAVSTRHHYGSRIVFDNEGYLYLSVGDRGRRDDHPQYLENHCGKIHRIFDDGRIPPDNPFVDQEGAVASIYSYGHRNPQGLIFNPDTKTLWDSEHGPRGGDELNLIEPGKNYGWPTISYGINYNGTTFTDLTEKEGMEQPTYYWVPSIAPCGMAYVSGDKYPGWKGNILIGSLRFQYLARVTMDGNNFVKEEKLLKGIGRLRNVIMGADGYIYFSVEEPGYVFRIIPL